MFEKSKNGFHHDSTIAHQYISKIPPSILKAKLVKSNTGDFWESSTFLEEINLIALSTAACHNIIAISLLKVYSPCYFDPLNA